MSESDTPSIPSLKKRKGKARQCPKCGAKRLSLHSTRHRDPFIVRYFTCQVCGTHAKTIETPPK